MLRTAFIACILLVGVLYGLGSPFYALLLYLWNAYFRPAEWVWSGPFTTDLSFYIAAFLVVSTVLSSPRLKPDLRFGLLGLFFVDTLAATLASQHPDWSWPFWGEFAKVIFITCLIPVLVTDRARLRLALLIVALSLGFEAAKQGWIDLVIHHGAPNTNEHPVLGDNNGVAQGMFMLVPILAVLAQTAKSRWERYAHRFVWVGVLFRGLTTYSRGGFLAAAAIGLIGVLRSQHRVRYLVIVVLLSGAIYNVLPQTFWARMDTITADDERRDDSAKGRLHFWQTALSMASDQPLLGVGFNGFQASYNAYDDLNGYFGKGRAVHSAWFGILAELGWPGAMLFVAVLLLAFRACARTRAIARRNPAAADLKPYANAIETSLVAYVVSATFLSAQYSELLWHLVGFSMALHAISSSAAEAPAEPTAESIPATRREPQFLEVAMSRRIV